MLAWLWPGRLKCDPVGVSILLLAYPRCSASRYLRALFDCPMYRNLHFSFSHSIMYTILYDSQVYLLFMTHFSFSLILTLFPSNMKGHAGQDFPHFFIPFDSLSACIFCFLGTLARISLTNSLHLLHFGWACLQYYINSYWLLQVFQLPSQSLFP